MPKISYILTEEEYQELRNKQDQPNKFLEQELQECKAELNTLRNYKIMLDAENAKITVTKPIVVRQLTDNELLLEYNNLVIARGFKKIRAYMELSGITGIDRVEIGRTIRKLLDKEVQH